MPQNEMKPFTVECDDTETVTIKIDSWAWAHIVQLITDVDDPSPFVPDSRRFDAISEAFGLIYAIDNLVTSGAYPASGELPIPVMTDDERADFWKSIKESVES